MFRSMTAYGRVFFSSPIADFSVEIQSVNRKFLDVNTLLPKDLLLYDTEIKKWVARQVSRGQINVKIFVSWKQIQPSLILPNLPLARQLKAAWERIAQDLQLDPRREFSLQMLTHETDILLYDQNKQNEEAIQKTLQECIELALEDLIKMKMKEGNFLFQDIVQRIENLSNWIEQIDLKAPAALPKFRQKLTKALEEFLQRSPISLEDEQRLSREILLYADKSDISEEITRFRSLIQQIKQWIHSENIGKGKKIEFILQELNREVNTIGSKTTDIEISHLVIEMKTELERIREQIQNVE